VDDDRDIVEGAAIRLQSCGFQVFTAYDGNSALEVANREPLDAILLDVRMPGLDGLGVLRKLRQQPTTADVPVAIMSGAVEDRDTALQSGAQYFLTKPYRAAELMEAVETMSTAAVCK
jgi:DNA-binding response OmpR family regulator